MRRCILLQKSAAAICLGFAALSANQPIVLQSPRYQQVFQRDGSDSAIVPLQGTAPPTSDEIRARAVLSPKATAGGSTEWTTVAQGPQVNGGAFKTALKLSKGGWYTIRVEARANGAIVATDSVTRVGIGDVFITAGQSNSANWGYTSTHLSAKSDLVVYYDGVGFVHAVDPIPGGFGTGSSPWTILGDTLTTWTRCPVCFRSASLAATPVDKWLPPGSAMFDTLHRRTGVFGARGVKAVLWVQGESDALAGTTAGQYRERLAAVIDSLRKRIGYRVDWFVSGTSYHPQASAGNITKVYEGQTLLWQSGVALQGPSTNDMLGPLYRSPADGVHFTEAGLREMAARWYAVLTKHYWPATAVFARNKNETLFSVGELPICNQTLFRFPGKHGGTGKGLNLLGRRLPAESRVAPGASIFLPNSRF